MNIDSVMNNLVKLTIIDLSYNNSKDNISAILGYTATESSFKSILALGILLLAKRYKLLVDKQPIIEATSGSLGVALAKYGKLLNHPVYIVVDEGVSKFNLKKMELLGANIIMADTGNYIGGYQEARELKLNEYLDKNPNFYNVNQHHNPLNPEVYKTWLIPYLEDNINFKDISCGVFCIGTGGHFVALAEMLNKYNIPSLVAEREGSITFGKESKNSVIRGAGNQFYIPSIIKNSMSLVKDVIYVEDKEAISGIKELSAQGIFVGGTSGLCYSASKKALQIYKGKVLTFFPDKGELYWDSIYKNL